MKTLLAAVLILLTFTSKAQITPYVTIPDLKQVVAVDNAVVYLLGATSKGDGLGGIYYYDSTSTATADDYNIIQPYSVTMGRWVKANQTASTLTQGNLFRIGRLTIFAGTGVLNSSGELTVNLTRENTANGTAIFSEIIAAQVSAVRNSSAKTDVAAGMVKSYGTGNKTITFAFAQGATVTILGTASLSVGTLSGTTVTYFVLGR